MGTCLIDCIEVGVAGIGDAGAVGVQALDAKLRTAARQQLFKMTQVLPALTWPYQLDNDII